MSEARLARSIVHALVAGLAALGAVGCHGRAAEGPPHGIVLVVLDTLRADALGAYGSPRPTSPRIDALAAEGVLFEQVISHAAWTLPGFVGLLSGEYVSARVYRDGRLRRSLLEKLQESGRVTAAFTEGAYVSESFGLDRGFDHFSEHPAQIRLSGEAHGVRAQGGVARTFGVAIDWLYANAEKPFFLLVHTYEPHLPYRRRRFTRDLPAGALGDTYEIQHAKAIRRGALAVGESERRYVRALYDGGVRMADTQVGRLLDALEALGVARRTVVALTSDHGEDLGDRNPRYLGIHQHQVYDEILRVPLILRDGRRSWPVQRVADPVRLIDVLPTLLDLAGVPVPADIDGRSLVPRMAGPTRSGDEPPPAYSELRLDDRRLASWRTRNRKLIRVDHAPSGGAVALELYRIDVDPREQRDIAPGEVAEAVHLESALEQHMAEIEARGAGRLHDPDGLTPMQRMQLKTLGYLDTDNGERDRDGHSLP